MDAIEIIDLIDQSYEQEAEQKARQYIGASAIGNECDAAIAFNLRGFPNVAPDPQLKRIFGMGHVIEDMVVADLKRVPGLEIQEVDPNTGKQWTYQASGGHVSCHTDGMAIWQGETLILEIKSMNDASFNKFKNKGMQRSHPHYFFQVQMYMGMSGVRRTLFIAYNKNRSVYHAEIVEFDDFEWSAMRYRIKRILRGEGKRIARDRSDWRCKGCFKRDVCWGKVQPEVRCSSCTYAVADERGGWYCTVHEKAATETCNAYEPFQPGDRDD
ncbi:YqaJ viral recombinase family protein [Endozoicomonas atrinae]|uniref:YqaJ viral recombinase family protein n=2 Tax=Endozoicomonas atrinae TaxID=1333660 RepID=UPI003B0022C8